MPQAIVILIMAGTIIACTAVTLGAIALSRSAKSAIALLTCKQSSKSEVFTPNPSLAKVKTYCPP